MEANTMDKMRTDEKIATPTPVVIDRTFNLPVHSVWRAITEEEEFKKWWGPNGYTCPYSQLDARVGGRYLNCMKAPDGKENWSTGKVKELEENKRLVITDSFSDEKGNIIPASTYGLKGDWPDASLITFELKEVKDGTHLHLVHEGIPEEEHDNCVQGWSECLDKLEKNAR